MRSISIICAFACAFVSVNARHVSLIASPACNSLIRTCVQGEEEAIMNFARYSESLPCKKEHMKVVPGTCTGQGFTSVLGVLNDAQVTVFAELGKALRSNEQQGVCWKDIQFRGVGRFSQNCTSDEERQFGFCFKRCAQGMTGEGPVCFSECSDPYGVSVGALCCKTKAACAGTIAKESLKFTYDIIKTIFDGHTNPIKIINDLKKLFRDAKDLNFPDCKNGPSAVYSIH